MDAGQDGGVAQGPCGAVAGGVDLEVLIAGEGAGEVAVKQCLFHRLESGREAGRRQHTAEGGFEDVQYKLLSCCSCLVDN